MICPRLLLIITELMKDLYLWLVNLAHKALLQTVQMVMFQQASLPEGWSMRLRADRAKG